MKKVIAFWLTLALSAVLLCGAAFAEEAAVDETAADELSEETLEELSGSSGSEADLIKVEVNVSEEGEILLEDYSAIEIPESVVTISDDAVQNYIDSILSYSTTIEQITEGVAQEGDTVNIDFSGRLADEEEPFDGGTAQGYDIVLGSGTFIEGFEEQLVGHEIGETFDINVTFPEAYADELAGKDAIFTITLNYKSETVVPELTDEFVQQFSAAELSETLSSVEDLREYTYNYLRRNAIQNAMMAALQEKTTVISYPEEQFNLMKAYSAESLAYYASMYASSGLEGYDEDMVAQMNGYATADDYSNDEAMYYMNMILMLDKIAEEQGISYTDDEVNTAIENYMVSYGYDQIYSIEEFKEMSGEAWVLLISKLQIEYEKVMNALEPNVVLVEDTVEVAEE